jgi:hypothetical protein
MYYFLFKRKKNYFKLLGRIGIRELHYRHFKKKKAELNK